MPSDLDLGDTTLGELCSRLFVSLPRKDQRARAAEYVCGLLEVDGRKSIRNIAALIGGATTEQKLHHFVSSSTWDWRLVRRALAQYVFTIAPPRAWVVRPLVIQKAGEHSVGVERRFLADIGQVVNAQRATGVWAASADMSAPVNWRLHLPTAWLNDRERRARAAIPDGVTEKSPADCAVETYLTMSSDWGLPARPVVIDGRDTEVAVLLGRVSRVLARIGGALPLTVRDPVLTGRGNDELPAREIIGMCRDLRRPVTVAGRTTLVAAVRVALPSRPGELLLMGEWGSARGWPTRLWITDMLDEPPAELLELDRLTQRVDRDFTRIADQVGIRDYTGRSYDGWHRHTTLASVAHTVAVLSGDVRDDEISRAC
ncbi:IS701 family transposase [Kutzneria sp. CA-103260]|uniref:IS701 family transposase n=1 Tax=Kutzneria sp. CA-103260 TaxID=2802641 RepID=UPI001BA7905D|nr:transposase [Kutzneria sp. CA-103260]